MPDARSSFELDNNVMRTWIKLLKKHPLTGNNDDGRKVAKGPINLSSPMITGSCQWFELDILLGLALGPSPDPLLTYVTPRLDSSISALTTHLHTPTLELVSQINEALPKEHPQKRLLYRSDSRQAGHGPRTCEPRPAPLHHDHCLVTA